MNMSIVPFKGRNDNYYGYIHGREYSDELGRRRLSDAQMNNGYRRKSDMYYHPPINSKLNNPVISDEYKPKAENIQKNRSENKSNNKNKNAKLKNYGAGFGTAVLLSAVINVIGMINGHTPAETKIKVDEFEPYQLSNISEIYDVPVDILKEFNNIDDNFDYEELKEVKIPTMYNKTGEEIEKLQDKLYSPFLSDEKRAEYEDKLEDLKELQNKQNKITKAYTDGKYVYFYIEILDNIGEVDPDASISAEFLKSLYGIKDGYIQAFNPHLVQADWRSNENGDINDHGYFDYTSTRFHNGDVVKVPKYAVTGETD